MCKSFGHDIRNIFICRDIFQCHLIALEWFPNKVIVDINMSRLKGETTPGWEITSIISNKCIVGREIDL
jgi:hypothetical protein